MCFFAGFFAGTFTILNGKYVFLSGADVIDYSEHEFHLPWLLKECVSDNGGMNYTCTGPADPELDGGNSFLSPQLGWVGGGIICKLFFRLVAIASSSSSVTMIKILTFCIITCLWMGQKDTR